VDNIRVTAFVLPHTQIVVHRPTETTPWAVALSGGVVGGITLYFDDVADLDRLVDAITDARPPAPGPPRKPSATHHAQGVVIPPPQDET
jgi:hypothetical protein